MGALAFQERAVLFPLVLGLVAVAYTEAAGLRRLVRAVRDHLSVWIPLVVLLAGYLVLHETLAPVDRTSPGAATASASLVGNFVGRNAVPGFVGGPWDVEGTASFLVPADWAVALSWLVVAILVTATLRRSRSAVWGWLLLFGYTVLDVALLFGGRATTDIGAVLGLVPRYAADVVPVLAIALALVVRACEEPGADRDPLATRDRRAGRRRAAPAVLACAYLASAAISTAAAAPLNYNRDDRAYVELLRADLRAEPQAVLFDSAPPEGVMVVWFGDDALVSNVVSTAPEHPVFDLPSHSLRIADSSGRLHPVGLVGIVTDVPTSDRVCVHHVTPDEVTPVRLDDTSPDGRLVARLSYYKATPGLLLVTAGDEEFEVPLRSGLNTADLVVEGPLDELDMRLRAAEGTPSDVCVVDVVVGSPVPG
jgi:hypothetical protein